MVSRLRDSTDPTKGGELSKGELKQMLLFCGGDLDVFRSLGKKPELPEGAIIDFDTAMTHEEKLRMAEITALRRTANEHILVHSDRRDFMKCALERVKALGGTNSELLGACGWDRRIAYNDEEWKAWRGE